MAVELARGQAKIAEFRGNPVAGVITNQDKSGCSITLHARERR